MSDVTQVGVCAVVILALVGVSPTETKKINADHLQLVTYATEQVIAPGSTFSLVFHITPQKGVHVYAPGADKYKIVRVTVHRDVRLTTKPLEYPKPEMYLFAPLDERVPVFEKPFTLTQPIAVGSSPQDRAALADARTITIRGTLEYQACDDRVCFPPESIQLSYTVTVKH